MGSNRKPIILALLLNLVALSFYILAGKLMLVPVGHGDRSSFCLCPFQNKIFLSIYHVLEQRYKSDTVPDF